MLVGRALLRGGGALHAHQLRLSREAISRAALRSPAASSRLLALLSSPPSRSVAVRPGCGPAAARRGLSSSAGGKPEAAAGPAAGEATSVQASAAGEAGSAVSTHVTYAERARQGVRLSFWLGLAGLGAVCAYLIGRELVPRRMSPNAVFNQTVDAVRAHPEITSRLGSPIKAYGRDFGGGREGRRNFVDYDEYTDVFGTQRLRIKFNVEGPYGKGKVYSEVAKDANPGEFAYVIFERNMRGRREAIGLVENRTDPSREEVQAAVVDKFNKNNMVLYGKDNDCVWTKKQKEELGSFAEKINYLACDNPANTETCTKAGLSFVPAWGIKDTQDVREGFQSLEQLLEIAKRFA